LAEGNASIGIPVIEADELLGVEKDQGVHAAEEVGGGV
jgi:hypothetical protein